MNLSTNTWYTLESAASDFIRSVQWCTLEIVCYSDTNITSLDAHWQLARLDGDDGTIITLRNRGKGPGSALAVFAAPNETQPGFAALEHGDPSQQWFLSKLAGSPVTWLITNVANGTAFELAERGASPMYMASATPASSHRWIPAAVEDIDDPAWSPLPSSTGVGPVANTTTATNTSSSPEQRPSFKPGVIAGITVSAVVLAVTVTLLFFLFRYMHRRRRKVYISNVPGRTTRWSGGQTSER